MGWIRAEFAVTPDGHDLAIAMIADLPFTAFAEENGALAAYANEDDWDAALESELQEMTGTYWSAVSIGHLPDENWNKRWEENFDPVTIPGYCTVRATFHPPATDVEYDIVIQPEMAFGTGHHATTRMMLEGMRGLPLEGKKVLDLGAGTAVLGIMAALRGAALVDAVEIEGPACESAKKNVLMNGVEGVVQVIHGGLDAVPARPYDVLLANINRNVLLEAIPSLYPGLVSGAVIGWSGFLQSDVPVMEAMAKELGLEPLAAHQTLDWVAQWWKKP